MQETTRIKVNITGSTGDSYTVTAIRSGTSLSINCTCQAGQSGIYCKHRFSLLSGDLSAAVPEDRARAALIPAMLPGSQLEAALEAVAHEERLAEEAKRRVSAAKKRMAASMRSGQ